MLNIVSFGQRNVIAVCTMLIKSGQHFRGKIHFGSESPVPNMTPFSNRNRKMKIMLFIKGRESFPSEGFVLRQ